MTEWNDFLASVIQVNNKDERASFVEIYEGTSFLLELGLSLAIEADTMDLSAFYFERGMNNISLSISLGS